MLKRLLNIRNGRRSDRCAAVIVAAGQSSRMKGEDKVLAEIMGKSVIERSIEVFQNCSCIDEIIVVTRKDLIGYIRSLCGAKDFKKVIAVVEGGATRVDSVMRGLDHVSDRIGLAAIHDGARPLITEEVIVSTVKKAQQYHAAAPAIPVKDTVKIAADHFVQNTPDRSSLYAVQTPQVFDYDLLRGALQNALNKGLAITDDCSAVEALGMSVYLSRGSDENLKITTPVDLVLADAILKGRE